MQDKNPALNNHKNDATVRGTGVPPVQQQGQDAHATVRIRHGAYLPHWTHEDALYSVTFRLVDSLPSSVVKSWGFEVRDITATAQRLKRSLTPNEKRRLEELFSDKVEKYLDAGAGECWMRRDDVAAVVAGALRHFENQRYLLPAWCVMPNHVHTVVQPLPGHELPDIVHSWKSFTSKEANRLVGRTGQFWQPEPYDHLIRDEQDFLRQVDYVLTNPVRAGLKNWKWVGGSMLPHRQDAHATAVSTRVSPMQQHGQDAHATVRIAIRRPPQ